MKKYTLFLVGNGTVGCGWRTYPAAVDEVKRIETDSIEKILSQDEYKPWSKIFVVEGWSNTTSVYECGRLTTVEKLIESISR